MRSVLSSALSVVMMLVSASAGRAEEPPFQIERTVALTGTDKYYYTQSRGTLIPGAGGDRIMIVSQETEREGSHGYRDLFSVETSDLGRTWSTSKPIESLRRRKLPNGDELAIGDVTPTWHAATKTVLATGKTFTFRGGTKEDRLAEQVSYAVFQPGSNSMSDGAWSEMRILALPEKDKAGYLIVSPNSGCCQRVDLPGGDILLPIRYRRDAKVSADYTTIIARCRFDGAKLTYVEHGNELAHTNGRGFYEPSLVKFGERYFLTLRNDATGYVTSGDDGLNYAKPIEWCYDDGTPIGTYNTQQHWVAHEKLGLYLVYTRRGAGNDHIFRHRAPLFIAKVDPAKLCLIRATEQVLLPHDHGDLGNFGVAVVSPTETWVVAAEGLTFGKRSAERNKVQVAKIRWTATSK